jgi:hypothetical protein
MRNLVLSVMLAATGVAAVAVGGMIVLAWVHGDGITQVVIGNLQTIAMIIVVAVAGVIQHYMGTVPAQGVGSPADGSSNGSGSSSPPAPTPTAPVTIPVTVQPVNPTPSAPAGP